MTNIYHYTKGYNVKGILRAGEIKREGDAGNYQGLPNRSCNVWGAERQVWLTMEDEMPFTAAPGIGRRAGINEFAEIQRNPNRGYNKWSHHVGGVFRFSFESEEIGAVPYITGAVRSTLAENGKLVQFERIAVNGNDDVTKWYHANKAIPISKMKQVEMFKQHVGWRSVNLTYLNQVYAA